VGFNLKRFLRAAPLSALSLYCHAARISILADHEWTDVTKTKVDALADAIQALPIQQRTRVVRTAPPAGCTWIRSNVAISTRMEIPLAPPSTTLFTGKPFQSANSNNKVMY
jgi:hypothetical protein